MTPITHLPYHAPVVERQRPPRWPGLLVVLALLVAAVGIAVAIGGGL